MSGREAGPGGKARAPAAHAERRRGTSILSHGRQESPSIVRRGPRPRPGRDIYHALLTMSWPAMIGLTVGAYLVINFLFALLYAADEGIANASPGSLVDAFFFSVQTMATIGYGAMYPKTLFANIVVSFETVVGLLSFALMTGLWFTRFSRPTARVVFSRVAVVAPYDGVPTLMVRMANERRNQILQAEVRVTLVIDERTKEGTEVRRLHELPLVRDHSPFFGLSWMVMHPLDKASPLASRTQASLAASEAQIVVTLAGIDETLNQTVHARYAYECRDIRWNHAFVDILYRDPDGQRVIDLGLLHDTRALERESGAT